MFDKCLVPFSFWIRLTLDLNISSFENGIEHVNISRSSPMEEHSPTIIRLILSMDLALIQLKDSLLIFLFSQ